MPNFGKTGMIPQITQIVHNNTLVKELARDHVKCKCHTSIVKKRKTMNYKIILSLLPQRTLVDAWICVENGL